MFVSKEENKEQIFDEFDDFEKNKKENNFDFAKENFEDFKLEK